MKYEIVFSKRKTLGLQVNRDGGVIVRAPYGVSRKLIDQIVSEKEDWIHNKLETIKQHGFSFSEGDLILYLGDKYIIKFVNSDQIELKGDSIYVPNGLDVDRFMNWFEFKADKVLKKRFKVMSDGYDVKNMRLSNARTRYGSCNSKGNINLSWRLIFCPEFVIDYVIIHELEHLNHMNHSKFFWNAVEKKMPNYKEAKKWLKENNVMSLF